jgi:hypothetical protein
MFDSDTTVLSKMKGLHENDAGQSFHERNRGIEPVHQEQVDHAAATQDQLQRHGADKRRHDQRESRRGLQ